MKKVIIYDFDKTLTYNDTLFGFFRCVAKKDFMYPVKVILYFCCMVLTKIGFTSNKKLKFCGIFLFLKGLSADFIKEKGEEYTKLINYNSLYKSIDFTDGNKQYFIISASFEEYLKYIFPSNVNIIGSTLEYKDGIAHGLLFNCYGHKKVEALKNKGITKIDTFYTDSYNDYPLALISKNIVVVFDDTTHVCNSIKEFKRIFKK